MGGNPDGTATLSIETNTDVELTCSFQSTWRIIYWEFDGTLVHIQSSKSNWTRLSSKHQMKGKVMK